MSSSPEERKWRLRALQGEISDDIERLPEEDWRKLVAGLVAIRTSPLAGKPLVHQPLMGGDLSDCFSYPVDAYRIVYRVEEESNDVVIVAIGCRQRSEVYKTALERLGRRVKPRLLRRSPRRGTDKEAR